MFPGITQAKAYIPNNHSNTDVAGPEILACSGGHRTDEHVIVGSGGEECISAGNIWRVNRLDRGHDPVMVTEVQLRTRSGQLLPFAKDIKPPFQRPIHLDSGPFDQAQDRRDGPNPEMATPPLFISSSAGTSRLVNWGNVWI